MTWPAKGTHSGQSLWVAMFGGLPADLRDVVGRAAVAGRVVVLQQGPHPRQRPGQVRIGGRGAEALRVPLVLQLDDPHVPERPQAARCRRTGPGRGASRAGPGPGRPAVLVHAARTSRNTAAASYRRPFTIAIAEIRQAVLRRAPGMPVSR